MSEGLKALKILKGETPNRIAMCVGRQVGKQQYANAINIIEKELKKPKMFYEILKEFVEETEINIEHPNEDEFARPINKQELKIKLEAYKHTLNMFEVNFPEVLENE